MPTLTYQYIRRRLHVKSGGNPFKAEWIEKDGVYMPRIENVLLHKNMGPGWRKFAITRWDLQSQILSMRELPSEYAVEPGNDFGNCWGASFYIDEHTPATSENYKLIAETHNIPK